MKRSISILIILSFVLSIATGCSYDFNEGLGDIPMFNCSNPRLMVRGKPMPAFSSIETHENHADIPLEAVLLTLGASFQKIENDDMKIEVKFCGDVFILDKRNVSLCRPNDYDILCWFYGGERYCVYYDEEEDMVFVDDETLKHAMYSMGMKIHITYDPITNELDVSPFVGRARGPNRAEVAGTDRVY